MLFVKCFVKVQDPNGDIDKLAKMCYDIRGS